jgi:mannose-6-phosphate isomerase-like protein (cupin superfamily)
MRLHELFWALFLLGAISLDAQKTLPPEVEITAEPHHHLIFQNDYVRVFDVMVAPRDATLMHRHRHDYVFVAIGTAVISNEVEGKAPVQVALSDGEVKSADAGLVHIARNTGSTMFHNIAVEFLQDEKMGTAPSRWGSEPAIHAQRGAEEVLFVKDGVRVSRVELQTAGFEAQHRHAGPHLVIAVSDLTLRSEAPDKTASNIDMKAGEVKWIGGNITHTVTNVGSQPAKLVSLEF